MIWKLIPILVVAALAHCGSVDDDNVDIDTRIREIFGKVPAKGSVDSTTEGSTDSTKPYPTRPTKEPGMVETCKLPSGGQGVCTEYYLCDTFVDMKSDGFDEFRDDSEDVCGSWYLDVCCDSTKVKKRSADHQ